MRLGTLHQNTQAVETITDLQARQALTQQQIASGRRVAKPSDDPQAAAEAEKLRSRQSRIDSEKRATVLARQLLGAAETAVADGATTLQAVRDTLLSAANPTLGSADRAHLAEQLRQLRDQLLSIANRSDGAGGFVFGGQGASAAPFVADGAGVAYRPQSGALRVGHESPGPVSFDGAANFATPAAGGGTQSIFARLDAAIATLSDPSATSTDAGAFARATVDAVDATTQRLQTTRVVIGERLRALDAHEQALDSGSIDVQSRASQLVDTDFARAISQLTLQQTAIEAAMKSYSQVARLSLFEYL